MRPLPRSLKFLLLALAMTAPTAHAASVVISPVTMEIDSSRQTGTLTTLVNQGNTPLEFTATLLKWTQQNGQDVNVPTRDAAVNPSHFTIAPGRSQVVRIGLRGRPSSTQSTYRLLLRQAPQPAQASVAGDGLQAAINPTYVFSLPLFVTPPGAAPQVSRSLERTPGGLDLVLKNTGTAHAAYRNLTADVDGKVLNLGSVYVLTGSTVRVAVPGVTGQKTLTLHSTDSRQQKRDDTLDVPAP